MKKYILIGLLCMCTTATAAPIDNIVQDAELGKLTISGTLPSNGEYTIQVLKADKNAESIDDITSENIKEIIKTMSVFETGTKEYSVDVVLGKNAESGSYIVRINGEDMEEVYEYKLEKYYDVESVQELFNAIKAGSKNEIDELLRKKENRDVLGLGVYEIYEALPEAVKSALAEKLYSDISGLDTIEKLRLYFNETCIILGISNADSGKKAADIIKQYGDAAGFSEYEKYKEFIEMSEEEQALAGKRLQGKDLDETEREKTFNEAVILAALENSEGTAEFRAKMEENKEFFGSAADKYFALSDSSSVDAKMMREMRDIKTLSELSEKINEIMSKSTSTSKPSGSGGGKTGGASSITVSTKTTQTDQNKKFTDMEDAAWAETAVNYLYDKSIVNGKAEGLFYPHDYVKREEFVKMMVLAFELQNEGENPTFTDVSESDWYYPYVTSAYKSGIVNGISEDAFGVGKYITRQDMAAMVYRVIKDFPANFEITGELDFADADDISGYSKNAVAYLKAAGIILGMADGSFKPKQGSTRAQAACIIYKALEITGKGGK